MWRFLAVAFSSPVLLLLGDFSLVPDVTAVWRERVKASCLAGILEAVTGEEPEVCLAVLAGTRSAFDVLGDVITDEGAKAVVALGETVVVGRVVG